MDLEQASASIDALISKRAAEKSNANAIADMWAESDRRFQVKRRLQLNAERYRWHVHLCEHFGRLARDHEARALELLEDEDGRSNA